MERLLALRGNDPERSPRECQRQHSLLAGDGIRFPGPAQPHAGAGAPGRTQCARHKRPQADQFRKGILPIFILKGVTHRTDQTTGTLVPHIAYRRGHGQRSCQTHQDQGKGRVPVSPGSDGGS